MTKVTLRDVARRAEVGYGTASRALSGRGSVAAETRARVQRAAEEMGFRPNAAASLLRSQGRVPRGDKGRLRVALLSRYNEGQTIFEDICQTLGMQGERFDPEWFSRPGHMLKTLWNRGFHGLILDSQSLPWSEEELARADWSNFSVVKWKRIHPQLKFHIVRHSAFDYIREAIRQTLNRCPGKTATLIWKSGSPEDDEARLGALMVARESKLKPGQSLVWREWTASKSDEVDETTLQWLKAERPQAILAFTASLLIPLKKAGWRFPQDAVFFSVLAPDRSWDNNLPGISGNEMRMDEVYNRALGHLRNMIGRAERGFTDYPSEQVIGPKWKHGETG